MNSACVVISCVGKLLTAKMANNWDAKPEDTALQFCHRAAFLRQIPSFITMG